jgi:hypothetical protein
MISREYIQFMTTSTCEPSPTFFGHGVIIGVLLVIAASVLSFAIIDIAAYLFDAYHIPACSASLARLTTAADSLRYLTHDGRVCVLYMKD